MLSKGFLVIVGCLAFLNQAIALKCYVCAGSKDSDCARKETSSMVTQVCEGSSMGHANLFLTRTDTSKDTNVQSSCISITMSGYQPDLIAKGCANVPSNVDPCNYIKKFPQIKACKSCNTDLCNE